MILEDGTMALSIIVYLVNHINKTFQNQLNFLPVEVEMAGNLKVVEL